MKYLFEGLTIACVLFVSLWSTGPSEAATGSAGEKAALQLVRASHLAATGRCSEAMTIAEASSPRDAVAERLIGKCAIQAREYGKAISALDRAAEMNRSLAGVNLYRGIALYHLEDYTGARAALDRARVVGEEAALLDFYKGLLLLRDDDPRESALAFERAAARAPELVEPVASYYAALAWQSLDESEPLNSAVARVEEEEPDGLWALEAERLMLQQAERHRAGRMGLQRWAVLRVGAEYDSNVVSRGANSVLPAGISSDNDWRGVWALTLGAEVFEVEKWTGGAMFNYTGNAHDDLDDFDQHYLTTTAWLDRELRATTLARLRLDLGYGWIGDDSYLLNLDLTGTVEERWGKRGVTSCSLVAGFNDYRYDIALATPVYNGWVDQDGVELTLGCDHELPLSQVKQLEPSLYGGYYFTSNFADGAEWDHLAHAIQLGAKANLPLRIELDVSGTYTRRDFREASFFTVGDEESTLGPHRKDNSVQVAVELARELNDWIEVSGRYEYTDNGSSAGAFDYKRHVGGAYVEVKFP